jgi:hexulose-6-phosphate isomerase
MRRIGIMQGRLLPPEEGGFQCFPKEGWMTEFGLAATAGLDSIEWIYDTWGKDVNPISSEEGISQIRSLAEEHGIAVASLCADYFLEWPLMRGSAGEQDDRLGHLRWLISRCQLLGIARIVLPFVDNSSIRSELETVKVIEIIEGIVPCASAAGVEIHLETSLCPEAFGNLLNRLPFPGVKANYDSGNSASLGYLFREESSAYGKRIGSVHVKDRFRGGGTVPLGHGAADLPALFAGLSDLGYSADFILQVARGEPGHEVEWAARNRRLVGSHLEGVAETFPKVPR